MKTRQLIILAGIVIFVGGCFGQRYLSSLKENSDRKPPVPAIRSVEFDAVQNSTIRAQIPVTGKLVSKEKIEIFAEVSGNLLNSASAFKEGNHFSRGQLLIAIDNSELLLSIQSQKSTFLSLLTRILPDLKLDYPQVFEAWKSYTDNFSVKKSIADLPEEKGSEKYFLSTQGVYNQFFAIKSQEARLAKFSIYAPFNGTVSQALIKPGTLVRAGQKLGEFINTSAYEMEVSIDVIYLSQVKVGSDVELKSSQLEGNYSGKVVRISDAIDASTQSAKVIVEVSNPQLKEGMYLTGAILTEPFNEVFALNKNQINDKGEVFLIEEGQLKSKLITPVFVGENKVITNELNNGDKVLRTIYAGAFNGARVQIEGESESAGNNPSQEPKQ
ncbi:HlyD family efflux transporter periplasmic adaptor subunit [bacterium]|nr:HlyD family efflux transporter periplasmic adaptor subunit [bacterium]